MTRIRSQISISLDGYVAGPDQSLQDPLGVGGLQLHEWVFVTESWRRHHGLDDGERSTDSEVVEQAVLGIGAYVMGRRMFGGGDGPWDLSWTGWWGDEPPFRAPVFVVTHHERAPLPLGATTFTFVTDGIAAAVDAARAAAGGGDVAIAGGASTIRQCLAAGLLDELQLHIVPVLLGAGERLLDGLGGVRLEQVAVVGSDAVTHVTYRVGGR